MEAGWQWYCEGTAGNWKLLPDATQYRLNHAVTRGRPTGELTPSRISAMSAKNAQHVNHYHWRVRDAYMTKWRYSDQYCHERSLKTSVGFISGNQITNVWFTPRSRLRSTSSSSLTVRRTRLSTNGNRAFPVAAARTWNSLPQHVTSAPSMSVFRWSLKAFLFRCYFPWLVTSTVVIYGHLNRSFFTYFYLLVQLNVICITGTLLQWMSLCVNYCE